MATCRDFEKSDLHILCTVCKNRDRERQAERYCTDCQDYYCLTCVKVHDDIPSMRGHKLLHEGQFPQVESKTSLPMVPTERCEKHGHKPVDMYCQYHDEIGCSACITVKHKLCLKILYIPDISQNKDITSNAEDAERKLEWMEQELKENICILQQEKQNVRNMENESIEHIIKFRKETNERLGELEDRTINEMKEKCGLKIKKIEEDIRALQKTKANLASAIDKMASDSSNLSQSFVNTKKSLKVAYQAKKCIEEIKASGQTENIVFAAEQRLTSVLEELTTLGKVTSTRKMSETRYTRNILHQAIGMTRHPVKIPLDTHECDILSSCYLENGEIVLADIANKKLKCLDKYDYSVRCNYELPWAPLQVCSTNKMEVAVSTSLEKEVLFVIVGNKLVKRSMMHLNFKCHGLAYAGSNLYISDEYTTVYVYTMLGEKVKQFSLFQWNPAANTIYGLAVSKDCSKVYIAAYNNGLIILDTSREVVKKYKSPELNEASDCYLASNGSVLVCEYKSNSILQFTDDGELLGKVLKPLGEHAGCKTVCCNEQMSKLIVGRSGNEIEVYDLL